MDIDTLRTKRDEASKRFDELQSVTTKQKTDNDAELFRLQGEYRVLSELIEELEPSKDEEKTSKTEQLEEQE